MFWTLIASKQRIEQLNFFDWLSNVKNLVLSNGLKHVRNVIKIAFFSQKHKNRPAAGGSASRPPFVIPLSTLAYSTRLKTSPFTKILVKCKQTTSSNLRYLCPTKIFFLKISDDVIACDLGPRQLKILATPMLVSHLPEAKGERDNDLSRPLCRIVYFSKHPF